MSVAGDGGPIGGPVRLGPHRSSGLTSRGSPQWKKRAATLAAIGAARDARATARLRTVARVVQLVVWACAFMAVVYTATAIHVLSRDGLTLHAPKCIGEGDGI